MRQRLLYATAWRDLRWTAAAAAIVVLSFAAGIAATFQLALSSAASDGGNDGWTQLARVPNAYQSYVDSIWFRVPGASFVLAAAAVFIAARVPLRRRTDTPFLLLLPMTRTQILLGRFAVLAAILLALCLTVSVIVVVIGRIAFTESYPLGRALVSAVLAFTGTLAWAGLTVALASFVNRAVAVGLVLAAIYFLPVNLFQFTLPPHTQIAPAEAWNIWAVTDASLWVSTVPWLALVLCVMLALVGPLIAAQRLARVDF